VILVALTQLLFRNRISSFALQAFMVGAVALVAADGVYSYVSLDGAYRSGMIIDLGWLACYALWPIAALHPSMARIRSLPGQQSRELSLLRIGALLVAMITAPIILIVQYLVGEPAGTGELGGVIVATMLLVAARVWILQREGKKAQIALERSDERLGFAQGAAGVSTWELDLVTDRLTVSDQLAATITGSSNGNATYEAWVTSIHPDDRARVTATFDEARQRGGDFEYEYRYCPPDGEEGWLFTRGRVFLEEARAAGVAVDITRRHSMEEQLKRSAEGMQMAQELGGIGTWDADLKTGERTWSKNLRRIYGVDDDAVATHESFMALVHPEDRVNLEAAMGAA